jgi:transposase
MPRTRVCCGTPTCCATTSSNEEGFLATLGRARGVLFRDEDFEPLHPSRRGRPSHPPSVLAALVLAQLFYACRIGRERRSRLDLSWKAALGLPLDHRGIPHACLAEFRARLLRTGMVEFLNAQFLRVAKQAGVIGPGGRWIPPASPTPCSPRTP